MKKLLTPLLVSLLFATPVLADKPSDKAEKHYKQSEKTYEKEVKKADKAHDKALKQLEKEHNHAEKSYEHEGKEKHDKMKSEEDMKELEHISDQGEEQRRKWWRFW